VRTGEPAFRGRRQPVALARQVERDARGVEQLGDEIDGGLERVREGELGGRLADDGEQRARAVELERERLGARARPEGMRGADAEGGQAGELLRARLVVRLEQQLQQPDGRPAERQADGDPAAAGEVGGLQRLDRPALGERGVGERAHAGEAGVGLEPEPPRRRQLAVRLQLPDDADRRADGGGGDARHLGGGVRRVERRRERLAGELERGPRQLGGRAVAVRERAQDERDVAGGELRRRALGVVEVLGGAVELDVGRRLPRCQRGQRQDQHGPRGRALGGAADARGRARELVDRRPG
jgi:hypothetical protein